MSPTEKEIAEAERLVLQFGGDTYESHKPAVRLLSWKMVSLINHIRQAEREACAELCDRFAARDMHPAECAAAIRGKP